MIYKLIFIYGSVHVLRQQVFVQQLSALSDPPNNVRIWQTPPGPNFKITFQVFRGTSLHSVRGKHTFRDCNKIFSTDNDQGSMKRGEKWFPVKFSFRIILDTYLGRQASHFGDRISKRKPRIRDRISRGRCGLRKPN